MLKKVVISILIILTMVSSVTVFASEYQAVVDNYEQESSELVDMQQSFKSKLSDYINKYGSIPFGVAAMVLNVLRIYSIPFCFVGIAVGSIYQYVIGIRKLDVRDKGFALIITFVTILLICQVLPLVFAIVVNGWRG
jgi:hypothetical protein